MDNLSREELIEALEKAEKNRRDRIGVVAENITAGAVGGGSAAAASVLLASTVTSTVTAPVLGSTFLGGLLGAEVAVATVVAAPFTSVLAIGVGGFFIGKKLIKLIKGGQLSEQQIKEYIEDLKKRIKAFDDSIVACIGNDSSIDKDEKIAELKGIYAILLRFKTVSLEKVKIMINGIENGSVNINSALNNAKSMLEEIEKNYQVV